MRRKRRYTRIGSNAESNNYGGLALIVLGVFVFIFLCLTKLDDGSLHSDYDGYIKTGDGYRAEVLEAGDIKADYTESGGKAYVTWTQYISVGVYDTAGLCGEVLTHAVIEKQSAVSVDECKKLKRQNNYYHVGENIEGYVSLDKSGSLMDFEFASDEVDSSFNGTKNSKRWFYAGILISSAFMLMGVIKLLKGLKRYLTVNANLSDYDREHIKQLKSELKRIEDAYNARPQRLGFEDYMTEAEHLHKQIEAIESRYLDNC